MYYAKSIGYIEKPFYNYYNNPTSLSSIGSKEKAVSNFWDAYNNISELLEFLKEKDIHKLYQEEIVTRKCITIFILSRYRNQYDIRKLWRSTYENLFFRVWRNRYLTTKFKTAYYLTCIGVYPIWKRLKKALLSNNA